METLGLRRHYDTWMTMILESDFVREHLRNITSNGDEEQEEDKGEEEQKQQQQQKNPTVRERVLQQVVTLGHRGSAPPRPATVSNQCRKFS